MKLTSWNVNGIRAVYRKDALLPFLKKTDPDILCLQETKAREEQLPKALTEVPGYHAYFHWPTEKKGYSGVAVYTKEKPEKVEYGIGVDEFDQEGRVLVLHFEKFVLLNIYFPNGGGGPERLKYKLDFYDAFLEFIEKLKKDGYSIVFCGDVNTAHSEIDLARPKQNEDNTGFLPLEREWIDTLLELGYIDTYRHFHPNKPDMYTFWDMKTAARDRNVGWRLDYFFTSSDLSPKLKSAGILSDVYGSDHCPIELEVKM